MESAKTGRKRRWAIRLAVLVAVMLALYFFRHAWLGALGDHLIREDALAHADAIVVLGGAPVERGPVGAQLLREGWAPLLVCTGERVSDVLALHGITRSEAALSRDAAALDSTWLRRTELVERGTSTFEEARVIRDLAQARGFDTLIVVTTEFHTRRAGKVLRQSLEPAGVAVIMRAAPGTDYTAARWWESEAGMIMVNNEWMKTLYYAVKH